MKTLDRIIKDIRLLSKDIERRWHRNRAPWGIAGAGQRIAHTVDMAALRQCITFVLDEPPADGVAGYKAAARLDAVLRIIEQHRADIERQLGAA